MALCLVFIGSFVVFTFFLFLISIFFRPEHHQRELISRNVHLVHQNWYRISLTWICCWVTSNERIFACIVGYSPWFWNSKAEAYISNNISKPRKLFWFFFFISILQQSKNISYSYSHSYIATKQATLTWGGRTFYG
jgi:hypothetical protein